MKWAGHVVRILKNVSSVNLFKKPLRGLRSIFEGNNELNLNVYG
jgi:hypothetical protein